MGYLYTFFFFFCLKWSLDGCQTSLEHHWRITVPMSVTDRREKLTLALFSTETSLHEYRMFDDELITSRRLSKQLLMLILAV